MKRTIVITLAVLLLFTLGCGKKKVDDKNIEQLQKEQGVPVRVSPIELSTFTQGLDYNATLSGAEEANGMALMSEVITHVNAKAGDRVTKGQIIVSYPQTALEARNTDAQTGFNAARTAYERMSRLHAQGAISQQDMDNVETQYNLAKSALDSSNKMINIAAPISGIITNMFVSQGERSFPGQTLFTIAGGTGYKAILSVPEIDMKDIRRGLRVTAEWNGEKLNGTVTSVSPGMDQNTKAFRVECKFPAYNSKVSFGITARINIVTKSVQNAIVVERQNIVLENGKKYVWLANNGKAMKREIETGLDNRLSYEVVSGLAEGDQLITEGINLLTEGAKIKISE